MKKILNLFFVTLGVIFFCLIIFASYLYIADPLNIKPLLKALQSSPTTETVASSTSTNAQSPAEANAETTEEDKNPILNSTQENALEIIGVDPASLPTSITPEQEACFVSILGQTRVDEIKAGNLPTATEFFQARGCIE